MYADFFEIEASLSLKNALLLPIFFLNSKSFCLVLFSPYIFARFETAVWNLVKTDGRTKYLHTEEPWGA